MAHSPWDWHAPTGNQHCVLKGKEETYKIDIKQKAWIVKSIICLGVQKRIESWPTPEAKTLRAAAGGP